MARFRPVSKFQTYIKQPRRVFSGSHNNGNRRAAFLLLTAQVLHNLMLANAATFTTPPLTMIDFQNDIDALQDAITAWGVKGNRGSHASKTNKDRAASTVSNDLAALSSYAQQVARLSPVTTTDVYGQIATILSGGVAVRRRGRLNKPIARNITLPSDTLSAPINLRAPYSKHTLSGQARLRWGKVKGASGYNVYRIDIVDALPVITHVATTTAGFYSETIGAGTSKTFFVQTIGNTGVTGGISQKLTVTGPAAS